MGTVTGARPSTFPTKGTPFRSRTLANSARMRHPHLKIPRVLALAHLNSLLALEGVADRPLGSSKVDFDKCPALQTTKDGAPSSSKSLKMGPSARNSPKNLFANPLGLRFAL